MSLNLITMKKTKIQWADSTVNPVMGCDGCELWPSPATLRREIVRALSRSGVQLETESLERETNGWTTVDFVRNKKNIRLNHVI
jgi:protein gp37